MSLESRLRAARDEYRRIDHDPTAALPLRTGRRSVARGPWTLSVAALVLLALVVSVLVWRSRDGSDDGNVHVDTGETTTVVPGTDRAPARRDTEPLVPTPELEVTPGGPYVDGVEVEVSAPSGAGDDWVHGGGGICATVTTDDGVTSACDPIIAQTPGAFDALDPIDGRDRARMILRRTVFTPSGDRDCNELVVSCHLVVGISDSTLLVSPRLTFEGSPVEREVTLDVASTDDGTRFVVTPRGLQATASWFDARERLGRDPALAPFQVSLCAFGPAEPPIDPWGRPWETGILVPGHRALGWDCDTLGPTTTNIDPDDPDRSFTVSLDHELYGYAGWSDCRLQRCYLLVGATHSDATGQMGSDSPVAAVPLPLSVGTAIRPRPSVAIEDQGPHQVGQVITLRLEGLPSPFPGLVGMCRSDTPMLCLYWEAAAGPDIQTLLFTVPEWASDCALNGCALALGGSGEGLPHPAAVILPIEPGGDAGG
jgi:hypothetical protein